MGLILSLFCYWLVTSHTKCQASLSSEHKCALDEIIPDLVNSPVYEAVTKYLANFEDYPDSLAKAGLALEETKCKVRREGCKQKNQISAEHFLSTILLMWPYRRIEGVKTNADVLGLLVKKQLKTMSDTIQNEMAQLQNQLRVQLGYTQYTTICGSSGCCAASPPEP